MVKVVYVEAGGARHEVDVKEGYSAMEGAVRHDIHGIVAECGGSMICATCHVYVDEAWTAKVGGPSGDESGMLEGAACEVKPNSRLSCQIRVTDALDGLVVRMPESQH